MPSLKAACCLGLNDLVIAQTTSRLFCLGLLESIFYAGIILGTLQALRAFSCGTYALHRVMKEFCARCELIREFMLMKVSLK